jgi:hypothetical protein
MNRPRVLGAALLVGLPVLFVVGGLLLEGAAPFARLQLAVQRTPGSLPSSLVVPDEEIARGVPVVSIYAEAERLYDPAAGLLTNPQRDGRDWEIPATVSYFDAGRLIFASGVGFRVHGSNSGASPREQSFRLRFRREYGGSQFMPGVLFGGQSDPITRLIVHKDRKQDAAGQWWHLVNPLAYDIARGFGAETPHTHPVRLFVNGELLGVYVLTEHVRRPFLRARYGHDNFIRADEEIVATLRRALARVFPLTMTEAERLVDVDNLTRWFIATIFNGTANPFQSELFRDETQPDARWFWVMWDLDRSFMSASDEEADPWRHDTFATTLNQPALQSEIVTRLIAEDPSYRDYLRQTAAQALNHQVTPEFLRERLAHYRTIARSHDVGDLDYLDALEWFLVFRPPEVRRLLTRYLDGVEARRVRVDVPEGLEVEVDGYRKSGDYYGWYFDGMDVTVALVDRRPAFSHWLVNDVAVRTPILRHRVETDTTIAAVLAADP